MKREQGDLRFSKHVQVRADIVKLPIFIVHIKYLAMSFIYRATLNPIKARQLTDYIYMFNWTKFSSWCHLLWVNFSKGASPNALNLPRSLLLQISKCVMLKISSMCTSASIVTPVVGAFLKYVEKNIQRSIRHSGNTENIIFNVS